MGKLLWGILITVLIFISIGAFFIYKVNSNLEIEKIPAMLYPEGAVEVTRNGETLQIYSEYKLEKNDIIDSKNSKAQVVFYDSIFVFLDPNTKVSVETLAIENVAIKQDQGLTWNKVTKLFNANNFDVKTPNSVASVRGTEFEIKINDNESTEVTLVDGKIDVVNGNDNCTLNNFEKVLITSDEILNVEITLQEKERLIQKIKETKELLSKNRQTLAKRLLSQNDYLVKKTESALGEKIDENSAMELFNDVDSGKISFQELKQEMNSKLPFLSSDFLDDFEKITDEIKKQDELISNINNK